VADARKLHEARAGGGQASTRRFPVEHSGHESTLAVLQSAGWALNRWAAGDRDDASVLPHPPAERLGRDDQRKLRYRRIDRYLTPLSVPMKPYPGKTGGAKISFHRPLNEYINGLASCGLLIDRLDEIPSYRASTLVDQEIPLFLSLRAWKQP
jgi:hypothetical protein